MNTFPYVIEELQSAITEGNGDKIRKLENILAKDILECGKNASFFYLPTKNIISIVEKNEAFIDGGAYVVLRSAITPTMYKYSHFKQFTFVVP